MGLRRGQLTKDIGATGIDNIRWGYIREDYLTKWNMPDKALTIDEMLRNSSVIGALRFAIEMSIRSVDWWFESDDEEDERVEFAKMSLANLSNGWSEHISDAILALFYGWSMFTITYENVNGRLLWRKLKPLKHTTLMRWLINQDGGMDGIMQYPSDWPEPIPIERMIIYKVRSNFGNPEGESILRAAWADYYYQKNFKSLEGIAYERNGAGYPVIVLPQSADTSTDTEDSDIGKANKYVRNIRLDEQAGLVLPFGWEFRFESPGQIPDFSEPISRYEKRILMAALSQFLMLGQDNVGAQSLSMDQTDLFRMAVNTLCDIITETFTQYPLKRLMRYNGFDDEGIRLNHSPAGDNDLSVMADFLQKTGSMLNWSAQDEVWLRSLGNLPERSVEEIEADMQTKQAQAAAMREAMAQRQPPNGRDNGRRDNRDDEQDDMATYESLFNWGN